MFRLRSRRRWPLRRSSLLVAGAFFYLLSNPLSAQIASSASFKIESVEEAQKPDTDAVDVSEFVVSTKDPQRKELLDEHPNTHARVVSCFARSEVDLRILVVRLAHEWRAAF
jgi:hypothetical protein